MSRREVVRYNEETFQVEASILFVCEQAIKGDEAVDNAFTTEIVSRIEVLDTMKRLFKSQRAYFLYVSKREKVMKQ